MIQRRGIGARPARVEKQAREEEGHGQCREEGGEAGAG